MKSTFRRDKKISVFIINTIRILAITITILLIINIKRNKLSFKINSLLNSVKNRKKVSIFMFDEFQSLGSH